MAFLTIWVVLWLLMTIKVLSLNKGHHSLKQVNKYLKIFIHLFLFLPFELIDILVDKNLWVIKWTLKLRL